MPKVRVDFSQARGFEAIPAGTYPVKVEETEVRESNSSEFPYINWTLEITSGEFAGRKQWFMTSLSPKATFRLRDALRALGCTDPDLDNDDYEFDPDDYLGKEALAVVTQETYNDKLQNRCNDLRSLGAASGAALGGRRAPAGAGIR